MKYYITTAIDYVNAKPHLGHAYEKVVSDVIARWKRLEGMDVFFLTGTDENAQKVVSAAKKAGKTPREFAEENAKVFKELARKLNISHDRFIRTTDKDHGVVVSEFFQRVYDNGDIYKGKYSGLYCEGCEAFYTEKDLVDGKCPEHGKRPETIKEDNYFFRLGKYQKRIVDHIKKNQFILPETRRNEILERLKEPLKDLSVSRPNTEWGIKVPFDESHTVYVWFDALINYLTGVGYPDKHETFWPADLHMVGIGINWFHTVIWPAMLMSAGLELPNNVYVHGYVNLKGQKMSKSLGLGVDPFQLVDKYDSDQLRYFLVKQAPFGEDLEFSEDALKARINGELVSDLGNLVSRVLTLAERCEGKIKGKDEVSRFLDIDKMKEHMDKYELHMALDVAFSFVRELNRYINLKEPWKLEGAELNNVVYNLLEGLRAASIVLSPFMPEASRRINEQLGVGEGKLNDVLFSEFKGKPKKGKHLFERVK